MFRYIDTRNNSLVITPITPTHCPNNQRYNPDIHNIAIIKTGQLTYKLNNRSSKHSSDYTLFILDLFSISAQILLSNPSKSINQPEYKIDMNQNSLFNVNLAIVSLSNRFTQLLINYTIISSTDRNKTLKVSFSRIFP